MIKKFDDGSYLELRKSDKDEDVVVSLCSLDPNNPNIVSVTSVIIPINDLKELVNKLDE